MAVEVVSFVNLKSQNYPHNLNTALKRNTTLKKTGWILIFFIFSTLAQHSIVRNGDYIVTEICSQFLLHLLHTDIQKAIKLLQVNIFTSEGWKETKKSL